MKRFGFALDRVLAWRRTQARVEEAALGRIRAEIQALDLRCAALDQSVQEACAKLVTASSLTPTEIGALEHYRASVSAQNRFLLQARHQLEQQLSRQTDLVVVRRREARLLEQLRDRRFADWQAATAREIERQAEESHMARFLTNAVE